MDIYNKAYASINGSVIEENIKSIHYLYGISLESMRKKYSKSYIVRE